MPALISLLLPTRGRPRLVERFLDSVAAQSMRPEDVEVILYVDDDDAGSHALGHDRLAVKRLIGPRLTMGQYNSTCLRHAAGQIIVLANDDVVIQTRGWDERLRELDARHADKIYLGYCNDLLKGAKLAAFPILSRSTCDNLDDPFPAIYRGAFIDVHLMDVFRRLRHLGVDRVHYLEDVVFEHRHYRTGKSSFDATYGARKRFGDDDAYLAMIALRQTAAMRLQAAIKATQLPAAIAAPVSQPVHPSLMALSRSLLFDRGLPAGHRFRTWIWFLARRAASRAGVGGGR